MRRSILRKSLRYTRHPNNNSTIMNPNMLWTMTQMMISSRTVARGQTMISSDRVPRRIANRKNRPRKRARKRKLFVMGKSNALKANFRCLP